MSKVDAQRALRDARYAAYRASRAAAGVPIDDAPPPPLRVRSAEPKPSAEPERPAAASPAAAPSGAVTGAVTGAVNEEVAEDVAPALCGHRNIGNKTCQRPAGHPEKNHRYT
jgi:hypothetical protein